MSTCPSLRGCVQRSSSPRTGTCGHSVHGCRAVGGKGLPAEFCRTASLPQPPGSLQGPCGDHSPLHPTPVLTSYCCGKLRMDGSGLTDTHFLLALDITRRTRRSLVQLQKTEGANWGQLGVENPGLSESWPPPPSHSGACAHLPMPGFSAAVFEVLVRLHHLPIPPALATHKLHLQVKGAGPMRPRGTLLGDRE
jgi:hypothetical protein